MFRLKFLRIKAVEVEVVVEKEEEIEAEVEIGDEVIAEVTVEGIVEEVIGEGVKEIEVPMKVKEDLKRAVVILVTIKLSFLENGEVKVQDRNLVEPEENAVDEFR